MNTFEALAEYIVRRNTVEVLRQFALSAYETHQQIRREYGANSRVEQSAWNYYKQLDLEFCVYANMNGGLLSLNERLKLIQHSAEYQVWLAAYRAKLDEKHGIISE